MRWPGSNMTPETAFLTLLGFTCVRLALLAVDSAAAVLYGDSARNCRIESPDTCQGLLIAVATFNGFALSTVMIFLGLRCAAVERSHAEVNVVTLVILGLSAILKLADATLPISLSAMCFQHMFDESAYSDASCAPTQCAVGVFYGIYPIYCGVKLAVGLADLWFTTRFSFERAATWYAPKRIFSNRV